MNLRTYHHGDLRRALLDAAVRHIATDGVDALSLRALARDVGVTHAAPYRHFESKGHLLAAIAEEGFQILNTMVGPIFGGGGDLRQAFRESGAIYVRFAVEHPGYFKVMYGPTRLTAGYAEGLDSAGPQELAKYEMLVAPLCTDGRSPRGVALASWAMVHGIAMLLVDGRLRPDLFGLADDDYTGLVKVITDSYLP
ncbi:MAG: TetR/AcrR family transcriptional regulator [Myxococcales bacterium]|nr:TetR/AcrR family transcriptional regulator [Myxococcales bacterium]